YREIVGEKTANSFEHFYLFPLRNKNSATLSIKRVFGQDISMIFVVKYAAMIQGTRRKYKVRVLEGAHRAP
ncbi:MAG: hypothetical protein LUQ52_06200, partial [Methylococcaceae bacterium]|nr:hypothetical protein [Methylococcaceae bacterium]